MKKLIFALGWMFAAALTLTVSCAKEQDVLLENDEPMETVGVPFELFAGVNTKTSTTDASTINWVENDALNVFVAEHGGVFGDNNQFTIEAGNLEAKKFTGTLASALDAGKSYDWKVLYPYNKEVLTVSTHTEDKGYFVLGSKTNATQKQVGNNSKAHLAGSHMPLYGKAEDVAGSNTPLITLSQVMSVVKVHVTNTSDTPLTVSSVAVTAPSGTLISGTFYVDYSGAEPTFESSGESFTSNVANLTVTSGEAIAKNESADFYIAVKPFSIENNTIKISVNGAETVLENKTATFAPAKIKTVNISYVAPTSYAFETVAELNALVTSESTTFNGYLTNAVVSFVPQTGTAFIKDATGSVMVYKSGHGLKQGQTFTGELTVMAKLYNSYSEITEFSAVFTGDETLVEPEEVALSALVGHFDKFQNAYVKVAGLTITAVNGKNLTVTDGANSYVVYTNYNNTNSEGQVITAVGTVTKYDSTEEIKVWKAADLTVTTPVINVTSDNPMTVANTAGAQEITYTISNPTGASLTASEDADWITDLNYSTAGTVTFNVAAQATDAAARSADITLSYTGAADVVVKVNQAAGPSSSGAEPKELTFNLNINPGGWPGSNSTTLTGYTYTLDAVDYTFQLKNVKCNSGYLMCTQPAVLGLPAIEGYKLSTVKAYNSNGCSTSTKVGISSSSSSPDYIDGGEIQTWSTTASNYTYTLTSTKANTVYYLYVTNKNAQIIKLVLTYDPAN